MDINIYIINLLKYGLRRISWIISDDTEAKAANEFMTGLESPQFLWDKKAVDQIDRK
jgi:hypothetical protein